MTKDEVIALAREAGLYPHVEWGGMFYVTSGFLENFAAVIAAHEREECAKVADLVAKEIDDTNGTATYIATAIRSRT